MIQGIQTGFSAGACLDCIHFPGSVHASVSNCMQLVWSLCNDSNGGLLFSPHHGSPLLSLFFAPGSCGLCFSPITGFNAYISQGWKTGSGKCVPQRPLNLHLGIVIFKCYYVKQQLCAVALLVEEAPDRVTSSMKSFQRVCNSSSNPRP